MRLDSFTTGEDDSETGTLVAKVATLSKYTFEKPADAPGSTKALEMKRRIPTSTPSKARSSVSNPGVDVDPRQEVKKKRPY